MKQEVKIEFESVTVMCPVCAGTHFSAVYRDNYNNHGVVLQLFCRSCGKEMVFDLRGEASEWDNFLRKMQNIESKVYKSGP